MSALISNKGIWVHDSSVVFLSYNIFKTKIYEEDYCEHEEDRYNQEHDAFDEDSPIFNKDIENNYWSFMENPIYDISREGSVDSELLWVLLKIPSMKFPLKEAFIQRLWKSLVWKRSMKGFHMIIQSNII